MKVDNGMIHTINSQLFLIMQIFPRFCILYF